jgi:flagellar biosynthesis component FlhA
VQKIRNLLPFSPAKEGPLRDLHKIKLIQTIADTIKPDPLVEKMRQALAQAVSIPTINPAPAAAVATGSHTTFHIIVNSTNNFAPDTKPEVATTVAGNIEKEVRRVLEKIHRDQERRKY